MYTGYSTEADRQEEEPGDFSTLVPSEMHFQGIKMQGVTPLRWPSAPVQRPRTPPPRGITGMHCIDLRSSALAQGPPTHHTVPGPIGLPLIRC